MTVSKPYIKLYEHRESTWANVPKLAQFELGYKKEDVEWISIELLKGGNFDPKFLKVNLNGTLPALQVDDKNLVDSIGLSIDEAEHKDKSSGLLGDFFAERQVALEK
ncbi:hypothetical protein EHS25_007192 [Saitozyma podzolica]|uniref:GST N-terminal domain-containing protein n=1 Tax=Saitozyma podzolica TaxID=1890683 RepID=A0A427XN49_9TREE|nr:hypothetical protein EHS25_007192 [Saitozyma podzolica]